MRKKFTLIIALLAFAWHAKSQDYSRCAASPDPVTILQPDGTTLTVIGRGNIDVNYTETIDGYTVVKNKAGIYEYAMPTEDGGLAPSGIKANENSTLTNAEKQFLQTQPQHLQYSTDKIQQLLYGNNARYKQNIINDDTQHSDKPITASFPALGQRKVLMILIQYPDLKAKYARTDFDNMMNKNNYKTIGSYKDFYARNSFGKLDLHTDVFGWYTADSSYKYYANNSPQGMAATRQLVANALDAAEKEGVDFSQYDNDKDGQADGILIVHAGPGAEEGSQNQFIWSHRWNLANYKRKYDNITIDNYAINPETRGGGTMRMVGIGVFCHEFGHLLGLPDLYDIYYKSEGVGNWSVMAGGNWLNNENTPADFCAYSRTYLKWVTPVVIDQEGFYTLKPASNDSIIYRINTPVAHEYFLLENRQKKGFDAMLNGKGLAIWHLNDSVINRGMYGNTVNANVKKKGIDLEEADGKDDLDKSVNRGDAGDLYPGSSKNTSFTDITTPNALNYNGNKSGVNIFDITTIKEDSSIRFGFSGTPRISFLAPQLVCQNQLINFRNTSTFASKFNWIFNEGTIDTLTNGSYKFTKPGEYYIKLKGTSLAGVQAEDSIKVIVEPEAVADFKIKPAGYAIELTSQASNTANAVLYWGDGTSTSQQANIYTHNYSDTGLFTVKFVCFSDAGCSDTTESKIRIPAVSPGDPISLSAFPNPFENELKLQFIVDEEGPVSITMFNILGQQVAIVPTQNYYAGAHKLVLDLKENPLPSGTYTLKITVNDKPAQVKLIKW